MKDGKHEFIPTNAWEFLDKHFDALWALVFVIMCFVTGMTRIGGSCS